MELLTDNSEISFTQGCAVALGNFDGVHLGHRFLINQMLDVAENNGLASCVFTFNPHPMRFYGKQIFLISTHEQKMELLKKAGAKYCYEATFNETFAALSPEDFIRKYLIERLNAKVIVIGDDFGFGSGRQGNAEFMKNFCAQNGLKYRVVSRLDVGGKTVSSSLIRDRVLNASVSDVPRYLGRFYSCIGTVVKGDSIGTKIGFPTANLQLESELVPHEGVYSGIIIIDGNTHSAMIHIGRRPTVNNSGELRFEVHILNFKYKELYGRKLEVFITNFVRDNKKFSDLDALKAQLKRDKEIVYAAENLSFLEHL